MPQIPSSLPPRPETLLDTVLAMDASGLHYRSHPHWYAVYTFPRHEKQVGVHCGQRDIESFVPLYREVKTWKNRCRVTLGLPLFPGYLFVRIPREERFRVLSIPGVVSVLGAGSELLPVPDAYIASLRQGSEAHKLEPHDCVEVGDRVQIVSGAMAGMTGVLLRKQNDLRVVLKVPLLNRSIAVEVTMADIVAVVPEAGRTQAAN